MLLIVFSISVHIVSTEGPISGYVMSSMYDFRVLYVTLAVSAPHLGCVLFNSCNTDLSYFWPKLPSLALFSKLLYPKVQPEQDRNMEAVRGRALRQGRVCVSVQTLLP